MVWKKLCVTQRPHFWSCSAPRTTLPTSTPYLQEVDVIISAVKLLQARLLFLQLVNLLFQPLNQSFCLVESSFFVDPNQLGHLWPHPLNRANHILKHLLALHHGPLCRVLNKQPLKCQKINIPWGILFVCVCLDVVSCRLNNRMCP